MISKVLIANRSEIACRIIRTCKEMGIKTVAVYSDVDKGALHTELADEAIFIGEAKASESYLNMDKIIKTALENDCDAIHPGYGFLSENSEFNKKVREAGLIFIGPKPEAMELLGSKVESRKTMIDAGVPVIPGMKGSSDNIADFEKEANIMGFPVLIKASAGGGGKGMRVVYQKSELKNAVESSKRESMSAFGSDEVFLEKYIESPRHIEFQVAGDKNGNYIHIFERECSIQRRHQKIIEETPSTALTPELREKMGKSAIEAVKAVNYDSIGTVEFLLDSTGNYYFLEVNARIQVEHPITEEVSGIDLVKLQIDIANGKEIPYSQNELSQRGHSIECRIYAEDAKKNFMPSSGKILYLKEPKGPGVRYDSGIKEGSDISVFYDPVMAKLICTGSDREQARIRMIEALKNNVIFGVENSIHFMIKVLESKEFIKGNTFTDFIDTNMSHYNQTIDKNLNIALAVASIQETKETEEHISNIKELTPWQTIGKWEIAGGTK